MARLPELQADVQMPEVVRWANALTRALEPFLERQVAVGAVTLTVDQAITTVSDPSVTLFSQVLLTPLSSSAATEVATTSVSNIQDGSFTIAHANNSTADRQFSYVAIEQELA